MISTAVVTILLAASPDTAAAREFLGVPPDTVRAETTRASRAAAFLPSLAIREACAKLEPHDELRIEGDFGMFVGRATSITPEGLLGLSSTAPAKPFSALQAEPAAEATPPLDHLEWSQVRRVAVRTNPSAKGAIRGAAFTTALVLAVAAYGLATDSVDEPSLQGFAMMFGLRAIAVGGILGGAIGAGASPWEQVYPPR